MSDTADGCGAFVVYAQTEPSGGYAWATGRYHKLHSFADVIFDCLGDASERDLRSRGGAEVAAEESQRGTGDSREGREQGRAGDKRVPTENAAPHRARPRPPPYPTDTHPSGYPTP